MAKYLGEGTSRKKERNPSYPDTARIKLNGIQSVSYDPCTNDTMSVTGILGFQLRLPGKANFPRTCSR